MTDERSTVEHDKRMGERVKARRRELGMSQEHLADRIGVTFQQIQKYENGINRMAASRLYQIAVALELPLTQFFDRHKLVNPDGARLFK
ncbi:MAG: helix-turn-helix transcriptional regulator [Hyphomonadaceae bacterium]|nr:helix-turn-helix transcriptional regulator [Hyphomonadaceae bacterium]